MPILINTLQHEGGETWDTGGHTNYGVTQKTYDDYAKKSNIASKNVKDLNFGEVKSIYQQEYYTKPGFDKIGSNKVAGVLFDYGVNSGTGKAVKDLQTIVGVKADGKIGKQTLQAVDNFVNQYGEDFLAHQILNSRASNYIELANKDKNKYGKYLNGWMNRISKLKEQYGLNG